MTSNVLPATLSDFSIPDDRLAELRRDLYHADGPGYVIFRRFLDPAQVRHMRQVWSTVEPQFAHERFEGKHQFVRGCPNFVSPDDKGNRTFHNFLWNEPLDELTHNCAYVVQGLRNRLSGRPFFAETMPYSGKAVNYRVVLTRNASSWIAPHRDYMVYDRRFEKNMYDLSRLQATLILAKKGVDYDGPGFLLENNSGQRLSIDTDVEVTPGDLIIWRYANLHSVEGVTSREGQIGFLRMIFPPETIALSQTAQSGVSRLRKIAQVVMGKTG